MTYVEIGSDLGVASVEDAIEMLRHGGVDLRGELSNITAAHADIEDELREQGYSEICFDTDDLAAAIRDAVADD